MWEYPGHNQVQFISVHNKDFSLKLAKAKSWMSENKWDLFQRLGYIPKYINQAIFQLPFLMDVIVLVKIYFHFACQQLFILFNKDDNIQCRFRQKIVF